MTFQPKGLNLILFVDILSYFLIRRFQNIENLCIAESDIKLDFKPEIPFSL